ncbi:MAG: hypothetical protein H7832_01850 [Magnetococcus sp. DMHC-6]
MKIQELKKRLDSANPVPAPAQVWRQMLQSTLKAATSPEINETSRLAQDWFTKEGDAFRLVCALAGLYPEDNQQQDRFETLFNQANSHIWQPGQ